MDVIESNLWRFVDSVTWYFRSLGYIGAWSFDPTVILTTNWLKKAIWLPSYFLSLILHPTSFACTSAHVSFASVSNVTPKSYIFRGCSEPTEKAAQFTACDKHISSSMVTLEMNTTPVYYMYIPLLSTFCLYCYLKSQSCIPLYTTETYNEQCTCTCTCVQSHSHTHIHVWTCIVLQPRHVHVYMCPLALYIHFLSLF